MLPEAIYYVGENSSLSFSLITVLVFAIIIESFTKEIFVEKPFFENVLVLEAKFFVDLQPWIFAKPLVKFYETVKGAGCYF